MSRPTKPRDYRAEYQRRIARGIEAGKSRSSARGHARAVDLGFLPPAPIDRTSAYEKALREMKLGASLKSAASSFGLKTEHLRRHVKQRTTAAYQNGRWTIFDLRPQAVWIATKGELRSINVAIDDASEVGRYWVAISRFLETNDRSILAPFADEGVRDTVGKFHAFEVRPNILRKLDAIGELNFIEIYADVAR